MPYPIYPVANILKFRRIVPKILLTNIISYATTLVIAYAMSFCLFGVSMDKLQDNIKALRAIMGWSQEGLSRQIGVSLATVQRWESNKVTPSRLAQKELVRLFRKAMIN